MSLERLAECAGSWRGDNSLQDPMMNVADESPSTAAVAPVLGGWFVRMDYTWSYQGKPQEGSLLVGFDPEAGELSGHWIDSWHMSRKVMALAGTPSGDGVLRLAGSYAAPTGPDWGWRIELSPSPDALRMEMANISPEGEVYPAVEAVYARA